MFNTEVTVTVWLHAYTVQGHVVLWIEIASSFLLFMKGHLSEPSPVWGYCSRGNKLGWGMSDAVERSSYIDCSLLEDLAIEMAFAGSLRHWTRMSLRFQHSTLLRNRWVFSGYSLQCAHLQLLAHGSSLGLYIILFLYSHNLTLSFDLLFSSSYPSF